MGRTRVFVFLAFLVALTVADGAVPVVVPPAGAQSHPEVPCQKGRYYAAAKYDACRLKVMGKIALNVAERQTAQGKCVRKYAATWARLQAMASGTGSTCDAPRFVDNGDGTAADNLTGLQWEEKRNRDSVADLGDPHDADNVYSWSATGIVADGAAFTGFLAALNTSPCFAGHCDWRLPNLGELQTLLLVSPFYVGGMADPMLGGEFGSQSYFWSSSSVPWEPEFAWVLLLQDASTVNVQKQVGALFTRAVRGGL